MALLDLDRAASLLLMESGLVQLDAIIVNSIGTTLDVLSIQKTAWFVGIETSNPQRDVDPLHIHKKEGGNTTCLLFFATFLGFLQAMAGPKRKPWWSSFGWRWGKAIAIFFRMIFGWEK